MKAVVVAPSFEETLTCRTSCRLRPVPAHTLTLSCVPGPATKQLCSQVTPLLVIIEIAGSIYCHANGNNDDNLK